MASSGGLGNHLPARQVQGNLNAKLQIVLWVVSGAVIAAGPGARVAHAH